MGENLQLSIYILVCDTDDGTDIYTFFSSDELKQAKDDVRMEWAKRWGIKYTDMYDLAEKYDNYANDWMVSEKITFTSNAIREALNKQHAYA